MSNAWLLILISLISAGLSACGVNPEPPDGELYTLDVFVPGARTGDWPLANHVITPAGGTIALLSDPYAPGVTVVEGQSDGINIQPAFSEGAPAAYAITEIWEDWPGPVWAQPLYFPVTGFNPTTGSPVFLEPTSPTAIFSIPTSSRFYSSYWQIYYFVVPAGTNADDYLTEKSIFDAGFPLVKGALTFCALGPANLNLTHADGVSPVQPLTGTPIPLRNVGPGWVEGAQVTYVDFGRSRYTLIANATDPALVEADALFQFAVRDPNTGAHIPLDLPRVGGTGPLHQHKAPVLVQGRPQFGSLWHEYEVLLNPAQGVAGANPPGFFVPNDHPALRAAVVAQAAGQAIWAPAPDPSITASATDIAAYTLRVAANPTVCFMQPNPTFPKSVLDTTDPANPGVCIWLDSQTAIESMISSELIYDTEQLSSCPLVMFNGVAVPP